MSFNYSGSLFDATIPTKVLAAAIYICYQRNTKTYLKKNKKREIIWYQHIRYHWTIKSERSSINGTIRLHSDSPVGRQKDARNMHFHIPLHWRVINVFISVMVKFFIYIDICFNINIFNMRVISVLRTFWSCIGVNSLISVLYKIIQEFYWY